MNKSSVDIDRFLPFGEMLRGFLEQAFISKTDLAELLKERGIFTQHSEKRDSIPWVNNLLLSPFEFDQLQEAQRTKEDNPKINTQTIAWSSDSKLIDSVPDNFDINAVLDLEFANFSVVGSPNFAPIDDDGDHLLLEFEIERRDYSKNWASAENQFKGSLELRKIRQGAEVKISVIHTANETKYVANKAVSGLVKHFKEKKFVKEGNDVNKITFDAFSNPNRVSYFISMTKNVQSTLLSFEDLVDLEFAPDPECSLPEKIKWMENHIKDLKLNGKGLQNTQFIKDKDLQLHIHLYGALSVYKFNHKGLSGKCTVSIGFPDYEKTRDFKSELELNIRSLSLDRPLGKLVKNQVMKAILSEFEELKLKYTDKADSTGSSSAQSG
ncbi:MAG: hypothetical protein MUE46_00230 [Xanthomonadales bacterium]|jgi:hypothetical protein|nr:hypothetical protein [Xanthomonadales bacterium]